MLKRTVFLALVLVLSVAGLGIQGWNRMAYADGPVVTPLSDTVGLYEKFEAIVEIDADFNNPYDPDEIRLDAVFTSPSGTSFAVPGFYYRDFEWAITDQREELSATDDWSWRVRFTPNETGEWTYSVTITTSGGTEQSQDMSLQVTESERHGFMRLDPRNSRYLAFDDGTPYFAVGENVSWYGDGGMADYEQWLDALHAADGNFIRVWMASWGFSIEWLDTGLGNYDDRQNRAYQLDKLFEMVEQRDIYIMLCLLNHGPFSLRTDVEWDANPYNAANGGPLQDPVEYATNPEAVRLWHQKLRYIAARWGYSPNLLAWEWWNEVNWTPMVTSDILAPWIQDSAAVLESVDPYGHLITHSGSAVDDAAVWGDPSMDFTQRHAYDLDRPVRELGDIIPQWLDDYPGKPFLLGEFGSPAEFETNGILLHQGLWTPPMHGSFGTGMFWWWDNYIHPNDLYYHFAGIAAFYADEDLAAHEWQLTQADLDEEADANVYGLQDSNYALLWIVSRDYSEQAFIRQYERNIRDGVENPLDIEFPEVSGAVLTLNGLDDGSYSFEWWDTEAGTILATGEVTISAGQGNVDVPAFSKDVALKVRPA